MKHSITMATMGRYSQKESKLRLKLQPVPWKLFVLHCTNSIAWSIVIFPLELAMMSLVLIMKITCLKCNCAL